MEIKFIEYTGKFPTLCNGKLTLNIDGIPIIFGSLFKYSDAQYASFWDTSGNAFFTQDGDVITKGNWIIYKDQLPDYLKEYSEEISKIFNENVPKGCCGGCI